MNRNFRIFILCAVVFIIAALLVARLPSVLDLLDDMPALAVIPLVLIAAGMLFFLRRARRTGEMPKGVLAQFFYASIFGIFMRNKKRDGNGDT